MAQLRSASLWVKCFLLTAVMAAPLSVRANPNPSDAKGEGIGQTVAYFRKAAEQGDASAQFNLALIYANGVGVEKDALQAAAWYRKAAAQGNVPAQFNLGVMYAKGEGVTKDDQQAVIWFRKAAESGHARAQFLLGAMYAKGEGVAQDDQQAYFWFLLSSAQSQVEAIKIRDLIEGRLSPGQRAAAQAQARDWKPKQ